MDFEKTLTDLEKIVQEMETNSTDLSRNLELYEKGLILYKKCKEFINDAEKKITKLNEDLKEVDFDPTNRV